jgi:plasmid stabilization system protein ParE
MGRNGGDGTREWAVAHPYVLLYEVDESAQIVRVLSVWHMSQDRP